ncbi:MAG: hypothetical protein KDB63_14075 [Nocardioidaceae bacterium]|nr:hypothetical protein [Nocardioidaceae bacterium]
MGKKITKADLISVLVEKGMGNEQGLRRRTLAELQAMVDGDTGCGGCDNGEHCGVCECCAASATYAARGNYNTVWVPVALLLAESHGIEARTEKVSVMLVNVHLAGDEAESLVALLNDTEVSATAALRAWQKTLDRKGQTDMEKYNQNRSFLAGYGAAVAQRLSGSKKLPVIAFARDMERALRADALKAGAAAARKSEAAA